MTPLKIAGVSTLLLRAGDAPEPLRQRLKQACPEPPRRLNRLIELALIGSHTSLGEARPEPHCPLYLAVTHGCAADTIALASAVAARNQPPSPIGFINLSSNMPGFYVASTLGLHGSNQSIASDDFLQFEAALELASLDAARRQALVGAVEECVWPLAAHRGRLGLAPDRALSESSHWLFVDQDCAQPLATVQWVRRYASEKDARAALSQERWPAGGRVAVGASLARERGGWEAMTGWEGLAPDEDLYSGQWAARNICRFVEQRAGTCLLHVSAGRSGCYAVFVTV